LADNEVASAHPLAAVGERGRHQLRIRVHVDAVQAAGLIPLDLAVLDVDLLSLAAHKFGGPKGVGILFVRRGTTLLAQVHGGTQERYRRAGTENVAGAIGGAVALRSAVAERSETARRFRRFRDRLRDGLTALAGVEVTGHPVERLPGLLSLIVRDADGPALQMALDLDGLACSTGSACTTGSTEPSHVLTAMGYPEDEARGALRLSIGRTTTEAEIAAATELVGSAIQRHRAAATALAGDALSVEMSA
jgi:cysteine desulfurase